MNMELPIGSAEQDPRPLVPLPASGLSGAAIALLSLVCAALLFLVLNHQRVAREQPPQRQEPQAVISAPPPLAIPQVAPPAAIPSFTPFPPGRLVPTVGAPASLGSEGRPYRSRELHPIVIEQWPAQSASDTAQEAPPAGAWSQPPPLPQPPIRNFDGPAIVQDSGESRQWGGSASIAIGQETIAPAAGEGQVTKVSKASPRPIGDLSQVIAVGTMIEAVLETPVDSSRPGMTRAIVSKPVRSFDGSKILIPRGARLVGEIGGQTQGGNQLLIQWIQLILPSGVVLDINSPGADASGRAGLDAKSHGGFGRFVGGVLQTAVTFGAAAIGAGGAPVYYAMPLAGQAAQLAPRNSGGKRLTVATGAQINVFVARTLDFSGSQAQS